MVSTCGVPDRGSQPDSGWRLSISGEEAVNRGSNPCPRAMCGKAPFVSSPRPSEALAEEGILRYFVALAQDACLSCYMLTS